MTTTATPVLPGSEAINVPAFEDYEAVYTSASSKTGFFTLQARTSGDGAMLVLIDIIPMENMVIASQRHIELDSMRQAFGAGPYFAWGPEFVVSRSNTQGYDWTRAPIEGGEPLRAAGPIENGGYLDTMFSPLLAALLPMELGTSVSIPEATAIVGGTVESRMIEYTVVGEEELQLASGISCLCTVLERAADGSRAAERFWVSREAPFVFRRIRAFGTEQAFTSDLHSFHTLEN
ncbi:hypothetical protein [Aurantiacibacter sp. D1-12]|uniref:hypothetical protein n=1 Tax=Aurantiacibacter sp. D1-12 TaxID=2993658 RepID=UPI00237C9C89|nr:hypothetical protein [Aurantiacibacter sp. D1-12]MDE1468445.1 hypothetical protein [Aurantiacibacter sp. D1-12]